MTESIPVENRAWLPEIHFSRLQEIFSVQTTMLKAMEWFLKQTPLLSPPVVIAQDEFSYDLIVPYRDEMYLNCSTS